MSISPESACSAPARIFINVDLPAPFSPTRASTSPACNSRSTPSSARTPGNDFPMARIWSNGASLRLFDFLRVGCRVGADGNGDLGWDGLASEVIVDRIDGHRTDFLRILQ